MSKIKNTAEIHNYNEPAKSNIRIHSHWNRNELVELEVNGERVIVCAAELKKAIDNCTNV